MKNQLIVKELEENEKSHQSKARISAKLASTMAIIGLLTMYSGSAVMANAAQINASVASAPIVRTASTVASKSVVASVKKVAVKYKNGKFTGKAVGFQPGTVVSVTISKGKITKIKLIATKDTPEKYKTAYGPVIKRIIKAQKTEVAVVSGATYSSNGMKSAVANALLKAKIKTPAKTAVITPAKIAVKAPVKAPVKALVKAPVIAPVKAPVIAPVKAPVKTPVAVVSGATK